MDTSVNAFGPKGKVMVLDPVDYQMGAQDSCMAMSMYSRSLLGMEGHMEKVLASGSGSFMKKYYSIEYHGSIGQNGNTMVTAEGVSILAAFHKEHNLFFNGQESSSRYIDFSKIGVHLPDALEYMRPFIDQLMDFYVKVKDAMFEKLKGELSQPEGVSDRIWENTLMARAFDVARGWLPAGCRTLVGTWAGLEYWSHHAPWMIAHPLKEVADLGTRITDELKEKYPETYFRHISSADLKWMRRRHELTTKKAIEDHHIACSDGTKTTITFQGGDQYLAYELGFLKDRTKRQRLPFELQSHGIFQVSGVIDLGSYRDLHRHRRGHCELPILTTQLGMNDWYMDQLPESLKEEAEVLLGLCVEKAKEATLASNIHEAQYVIPIGYNVALEMSQPVDQMYYIAELRSALTVHPTARAIAREMAAYLRTKFGDVHPCHASEEPDGLDPKRGKQTITNL